MNRKFIVLPKVKRRTLKDQEESKMSGKITVLHGTDKIMQIISDRFENTWRLHVLSEGIERTWTLTLRPKEAQV
jgi:hypothetical protein